MRITFDRAKRDGTFIDRGLAFEDAAIVFAGHTLDAVDDRFDYGEERMISVGQLGWPHGDRGMDSTRR